MSWYIQSKDDLWQYAKMLSVLCGFMVSFTWYTPLVYLFIFVEAWLCTYPPMHYYHTYKAKGASQKTASLRMGAELSIILGVYATSSGFLVGFCLIYFAYYLAEKSLTYYKKEIK